MRRRREKALSINALVLTLSIVLILALSPSFAHLSAVAQSGASIDLYTDKTPFNGKGVNQSSDTFEPQDLVVLHAIATYNDAPECNQLVAFQIDGPPNELQNVTVIGSGTTGETGIANFSFRIPWPCENAEEIIFGEWASISTVRIADQLVVDTMTFRVAWMIEVTEMTTLNPELQPQSIFMRQDTTVFNLTVENNAQTARSATIKIDVQDSKEYPIIDIQTENILFQPGKSNLQASSQIPNSAEAGLANASATPFTASPETGGRAYSPAFYTTFTVAEAVPAKDIAVTNVQLSNSSVYKGETVTIDVTVLNKGTESSSFDLSVYCNSTLIQTHQNARLAPSAQDTFNFTWNTNAMDTGFYQISASAPLAEDPTPSDNTYIDGIVEIKSEIPTPLFPTIDIGLFFFIIVILGVIASVIFIFLLFVNDKMRRRKKQARPTYTVIAHPHI